jgi:hypothetical protein
VCFFAQYLNMRLISMALEQGTALSCAAQEQPARVGFSSGSGILNRKCAFAATKALVLFAAALGTTQVAPCYKPFI